MPRKNGLHKGDAEGKDRGNDAQGKNPAVTNSLSGPDNQFLLQFVRGHWNGKAHLRTIVWIRKKIALNFTASL